MPEAVHAQQPEITVSLADPEAMLRAMGSDPVLEPMMHEAREKLMRALEDV